MLETYQPHLMTTESWRQNAPPLPPFFTSDRNQVFIEFTVNFSWQYVALTLHYYIETTEEGGVYMWGTRTIILIMYSNNNGLDGSK